MGTDEPPVPHPARRYLWWPLGVAAAWLAVVATGVEWPPVLLGLPCVLVMACVLARGPFRSGWLPPLVRVACAIVPLVVVQAQNPRYDRWGLNQGMPGVVTPGEFWSHAARAQLVATLVVELGVLALARRYRSD